MYGGKTCLHDMLDTYYHFRWVWTEAAQQSALEEAFGIGGFGYPAMVAVNGRKMKYRFVISLFCFETNG